MAAILAPQGVLNRVRASLTFTTFPALNVTSPFLARAGLTLTFNMPRSVQIDTMTGVVQSPEPYISTTVTAALIRTQPLVAAWQQQEQLNVLIGDMTLRPDVVGPGTLGLYQFSNTALQSVRELTFAGQDPSYVIELRAYMIVNQQLFDT